MNFQQEIQDIALQITQKFRRQNNSKRNEAIFCERYGAVNIGEKITLQSLSRRHKMTRESVRLILNKMGEAAKSIEINAPACIEALESKSYLNLPNHQADGFAAFCQEILSKNALQEPLKSQATHAISSASMRLVARNGLAQMHIAYTMTCEALAPDHLSFEDFKKILYSTPNLIWLNEKSGWYAFIDDIKAGKRNRLRNQIFKMLCAAPNSLDIEEIYAQLGRCRERGAEQSTTTVWDTPFVSIQTSVLKTFLECIPEVEHAGFNDYKIRDDLRTAVQLEHLSDLEKGVLSTLTKNNGIASRATMRKELIETGVAGLPAFTATWETSPILTPVERGLCRLVGHTINCEALEAARLSNRREPQ
jgi:hypothetical protein